LLAALLLGTLGVDESTIVADYALTEATMPRFFEAMKLRYPERVETMAKVPAGFMSASPEAMQITLRSLGAAHGSIRNYVRDIGVSDDVIGHLEAVLLTTGD
jgi:protein-tyrosine phosphatase